MLYEVKEIDKKQGQGLTIGLDIGTNSVGWAVIDNQFNLVQGKKKILEIAADGTKKKSTSRTNLWGVRLFDEGSTAEKRRLSRGMRRRLARRAQRLKYLQNIFADEIVKFDESFFIRLRESYYQNEDTKNKTIITDYPLFNGMVGDGETYPDDKEYYKAYPTIYHLRNRLMKDHSQADLRLVYLAIHHILKYRGHFINQGESFDLNNVHIDEKVAELYEVFTKYINTILSNNKEKTVLSETDKRTFVEIFENRDWSNSKKVFEADQYLTYQDKNAQKQLKALYNAIVGNGINLRNLFNNENYQNKENEVYPKPGDFKYSKEDYETKLAELENNLREEEFEIIILGKQVYEAIVLSKILIEDTLSASMVYRYEEHHQQLEALKVFAKSISQELYEHIFKEYTVVNDKNKETKKVGVYQEYVEGLGDPQKHSTREDFYKQLKKCLENAIPNLKFSLGKEDKEAKSSDLGQADSTQGQEEQPQEIYEGMESNQYLLKQQTSDKGAIPNIESPLGNENKEAKLLDLEHVDLTQEQKEQLQEIYEWMESDQYLLKQRTSDNGAIPYQVHESELIQIIENQQEYYPFLGDQSQITQETTAGEKYEMEYKIQILMKFRIPYYVGPLARQVGWVREDGELKPTGNPSENSWLVRKSSEKITPWNFDEVVDKEQSASNFIERMTGYCTYLLSEKILPKQSLIYQEFTVYNELMSCGYYQGGKKEYFSPELKKDIVDKLFKRKKEVTAKDMLDFLHNDHGLPLQSIRELFGIDQGVKSPRYNTSLSTFIDLTKQAKISENILEENQNIFEQIVKWQTIFEDKKILKKTIARANQEEWNNLLSVEQVKALSRKHYTGWGRLSKKLLSGLKTSDGITILESLKTKPYNNFMRLLEDEAIKEKIKEAQVKGVDIETLNYDVVDNLAGSPAIKKGIWQSLKIVDELVKILGADAIDRIVVEMARSDGGSRKVSRKKKIEDFYKKFKEKTGQELVNDLRKELAATPKARFSNERVYLYFLQNGKCMYSGNDLNLGSLSEYEVDHIIPQTYIKDNSWDNKVLVLKKENQDKRGDTPSEKIVHTMQDFWYMLAKNGQVSPRKLANLTRGELTDKQKEGFIGRQLVETRQITKHVATLLAEHFKEKEIEILTPKSGLTSQFRDGIAYISNNEYIQRIEDDPLFKAERADANFYKVSFHAGFPKDRDLNDYHHAHDAYLNAVVATYIYGIRPDLRNMWVYGEYQKNEQKEIGKDASQREKAYRQLLNGMIEPMWRNIDWETGEIHACYPNVEVWKRDEVIAKISEILHYRNINIVKKTELQTGKFGDESVYKANKKTKNYSLGIKGNLNPNHYGGTKGPVSACAVVVKNQKDNLKTLSIPAMYMDKYLSATDKTKFLQDMYPNENIVEIVVEEVTKYTKYILPNGSIRLMSSYQEAMSGLQLPMMDTSKIKSKDSTGEELFEIYQEIALFIQKNKLFAEKKLPLLDETGAITENFKNFPIESQKDGKGKSDYKGKKDILKEMLGLVRGTNQNLEALSKAGLGTTTQQLNTLDNTITQDSTLIYQSITGLYETRRKL